MIRLARRLITRGIKSVSVAIPLILSLLWFEHNTPLELPAPTGAFRVGRTSLHWVDRGRAEVFAPTAGSHRELIAWMWYPAQATPSLAPAPYFPKPWQVALAAHAGVFLTQFLNRNPAHVKGHSTSDPPVALARLPFPVIVLRSGIGAFALDYTTLAEDLASHGYIVLGMDAPYSTSVVVMPDGRTIHKTDDGNPGDAPMSEELRSSRLETLLGVWTADTRFALDQLERLNDKERDSPFFGRLDLRAVGIAGHSFGGATAAELCYSDARCRAGIDMDGALWRSAAKRGLTVPFLFLLSDRGDIWSSPDCEICSGIRQAAQIPGDRLIVTLAGANHFTFSDQALLKSQMVMRALRAAGVIGALDGTRGLQATRTHVREFFNVHLRGAPRAALDSSVLVPYARIEPR